MWINDGDLPLEDILTLCSFIHHGLANLIKYLGRNNRICLWVSIVLSLIAIALTVTAAILRLIHENYTIDRDTTIKVPKTLALYAYLLAEFCENNRRNAELICDAYQILKTLNNAHPERENGENNVSNNVSAEESQDHGACILQVVQAIKIFVNVFALLGFMVVLVVTSRLAFCSLLSCH